MNKVRSFLFSIRAQLLLVSLVLLLIPVIGFRFVMDMQMYLRAGQQQVLVSTGRLLSATLSDRPQVMTRELLPEQGEDAERRRLVALFGSSAPQTASSLGAAYTPSEDIERILAVVAKNASRIWVVDTRLRVRGLAGNLNVGNEQAVLDTVTPSTLQHMMRSFIFRFFLADSTLSVADDVAATERAVMSQVNRALN